VPAGESLRRSVGGAVIAAPVRVDGRRGPEGG